MADASNGTVSSLTFDANTFTLTTQLISEGNIVRSASHTYTGILSGVNEVNSSGLLEETEESHITYCYGGVKPNKLCTQTVEFAPGAYQYSFSNESHTTIYQSAHTTEANSNGATAAQSVPAVKFYTYSGWTEEVGGSGLAAVSVTDRYPDSPPIINDDSR